MSQRQLPESFADLEPFGTWALPTQRERERKRSSSSREELEAFYEGMLARVDPIMAYLNQFPLERMPEDVRRLFHLALSLAEIAPFVELYDGQSRVPNSFEETRFVALHGDETA